MPRRQNLSTCRAPRNSTPSPFDFHPDFEENSLNVSYLKSSEKNRRNVSRLRNKTKLPGSGQEKKRDLRIVKNHETPKKEIPSADRLFGIKKNETIDREQLIVHDLEAIGANSNLDLPVDLTNKRIGMVQGTSSNYDYKKLTSPSKIDKNHNSVTANVEQEELISECLICGNIFESNDTSEDRQIHLNSCLDRKTGVTVQNNIESDELLAKSLQRESAPDIVNKCDFYYCDLCHKNLTSFPIV